MLIKQKAREENKEKEEVKKGKEKVENCNLSMFTKKPIRDESKPCQVVMIPLE